MPRLSVQNAGYLAKTHPGDKGQLGFRRPKRAHLSNGIGPVLVKFGKMVVLTPATSGPSPRLHVGHVFGMGSKAQVGGVDALAVVARMENVKFSRRLAPMHNLPSNPAGLDEMAANPHPPVVSLGPQPPVAPLSGPEPALVLARLGDLSPEPLLKSSNVSSWHSGLHYWSHYTTEWDR